MMGERMIVGILSLLIGCDETEQESKPCDVELYFADVDGDGFGSPYVYEESCEVPEGFVSNNQDCNDADADQFPEQVWYIDIDGDGYGDPLLH